MGFAPENNEKIFCDQNPLLYGKTVILRALLDILLGCVLHCGKRITDRAHYAPTRIF